jgi:HEPN domain-containing protein
LVDKFRRRVKSRVKSYNVFRSTTDVVEDSSNMDLAMKDFRAARRSAAEGRYALACMAAQQAAMEALVALAEASGRSAGGRTLVEVLEELGGEYDVSSMIRAASELDSYYEGGGDESDGYVLNEIAAARALTRAEQLIVWANDHISRTRTRRRSTFRLFITQSRHG